METTFKRFFTLVELLVVIAIISILAGMLLPALQRARDSAVKIDCAGRQRQVALSGNLYANDYDDVLVWGDRPNASSGDWSSWGRTRVEGGYATREVFFCPNYPDKLTPADTAYYKFLYFGYGMLTVQNDPDWPAGLADKYGDFTFYRRHYATNDIVGEFHRVTRMKKSSTLMLHSDSIDGTDLTRGSWTVSYNNYPIGLNHGSSTNLAFADLHVESLTPRQCVVELGLKKVRTPGNTIIRPSTYGL